MVELAWATVLFHEPTGRGYLMSNLLLLPLPRKGLYTVHPSATANISRGQKRVQHMQHMSHMQTYPHVSTLAHHMLASLHVSFFVWLQIGSANMHLHHRVSAGKKDA